MVDDVKHDFDIQRKSDLNQYCSSKSNKLIPIISPSSLKLRNNDWHDFDLLGRNFDFNHCTSESDHVSHTSPTSLKCSDNNWHDFDLGRNSELDKSTSESDQHDFELGRNSDLDKSTSESDHVNTNKSSFVLEVVDFGFEIKCHNINSCFDKKKICTKTNLDNNEVKLEKTYNIKSTITR